MSEFERAIKRTMAKKELKSKHQTIYRWIQNTSIPGMPTVPMARCCRTSQALQECFVIEDDVLDEEHVKKYQEQFHPDKVPFYIVQIARMPILTISEDFMIRLVHPIVMVQQIIRRVPTIGSEHGFDNRDESLKQQIADEITKIENMPRPVGFRRGDDIELVWCDLLVPKDDPLYE